MSSPELSSTNRCGHCGLVLVAEALGSVFSGALVTAPPKDDQLDCRDAVSEQECGRGHRVSVGRSGGIAIIALTTTNLKVSPDEFGLSLQRQGNRRAKNGQRKSA